MATAKTIKQLKAAESVIDNWLSGKTLTEMYKAMQSDSYYGLMEAKESLDLDAALTHAKQFIQDNSIEQQAA
jgi:hypothetical protein